MAYQSRMVSLVRTILDILAQGLPTEWGCSPEVFHDLLVKPSIPMRFLHYAPMQAEEDARQFGGKAISLTLGQHDTQCLLASPVQVMADHTDFGCVFIILQKPGTKGPEVYHPPTESWVPVPMVENTFVVNMGDMTQRYTEGVLPQRSPSGVDQPSQSPL